MTDPTSVSGLHRAAMGEMDVANSATRRACDLERQALDKFLASDKSTSQPTRAVLSRSLAWIAVQARRRDLALWAVGIGLSENPDGIDAPQLRAAMEAAFAIEVEQ